MHVVTLVLIAGSLGCTGTPASIDVQPPDLILRRTGQSKRLHAVAKDRHGKALPDAKISFQALTPQILGVDPNSGEVTALQSGDGLVMVRAGEIEQKVAVRIRIASTIEIDPDRPVYNLGVTTTLKAMVVDDRGKPMLTGQSIRWESSDPSVASIDDQGQLRTLNEGQTTITAHAGSVDGSTRVTVHHEKYSERTGWQ